jgi:hypothetical protein
MAGPDGRAGARRGAVETNRDATDRRDLGLSFGALWARNIWSARMAVFPFSDAPRTGKPGTCSGSENILSVSRKA